MLPKVKAERPNVPVIMVTFHPREIWQRVEWADGEAPPRTEATGAEEP